MCMRATPVTPPRAVRADETHCIDHLHRAICIKPPISASTSNGYTEHTRTCIDPMPLHQAVRLCQATSQTYFGTTRHRHFVEAKERFQVMRPLQPHQQPHQHTAAASTTSSTRMDTCPLTVLLLDMHDTDDGIDRVRRLRLHRHTRHHFCESHYNRAQGLGKNRYVLGGLPPVLTKLMVSPTTTSSDIRNTPATVPLKVQHVAPDGTSPGAKRRLHDCSSVIHITQFFLRFRLCAASSSMTTTQSTTTTSTTDTSP